MTLEELAKRVTELEIKVKQQQDTINKMKQVAHKYGIQL